MHSLVHGRGSHCLFLDLFNSFEVRLSTHNLPLVERNIQIRRAFLGKPVATHRVKEPEGCLLGCSLLRFGRRCCHHVQGKLIYLCREFRDGTLNGLVGVRRMGKESEVLECRCHIPEDSIDHSHGREILQSRVLPR